MLLQSNGIIVHFTLQQFSCDINSLPICFMFAQNADLSISTPICHPQNLFK